MKRKWIIRAGFTLVLVLVSVMMLGLAQRDAFAGKLKYVEVEVIRGVQFQDRLSTRGP
jgi:hypothetical protein